MHLLLLYHFIYLAIWQQEETIIKWIIITLVFIGILIFVLIRILTQHLKQQYENKLKSAELKHQYEVQLHDATISSIENERKRLAADLHDALISKLATLKFQIHLGMQKQQIDEQLSDCIQESRRISHDLFPPLLQEKQIDEIILSAINPWNEAFQIIYRNDCRKQKDFSEQAKLNLVRIVQEVLMNSFKHAQANQVNIHLRVTNNLNLLSIADNGIGIPKELSNRGIGFKNIQNRIQQLGGTFKLKSVNGTKYIISF